MIHPLSGLLHPQRIAVFGPTEQSGSAAETVWRNLQAGAVSAVAIDANQPTSHHHFTTLNQAPWQPDLALITANTRQALIDCAYANVPLAVISQETDEVESSISGLRILQSGPFGLLRPDQHIANSCLEPLATGKVAVLSQSGVIGATVSQMLRQHGLGCSLFAVVDPVSDVQIHELLWLLGQDEQTEVICVYLDVPTHDRLLLDTISSLTKQRPVIVLTRASADPLWQTLCGQTGALLVDSFSSFESLLVSVSQPAHPAHRQLVPSPTALEASWRYASALRHLSGIDDHWLGLASGGVAPRTKSASESITWLDDAPETNRQRSVRATGLVASVHTAMHHLDHSSPSLLPDGLKITLRQQLQAIPHQASARLPQLADWLAQAELPIIKGLWLDEGQSLDWQIKQVGWPVVVWTDNHKGQIEASAPLASLSSVRQSLRHHQSAWLQPLPQHGLEVYFSAERHPQFGPMLHGQLAAMYGGSRSIDHLLPLNQLQAEQLVRQLALPALASQVSSAGDQIAQDLAKTIVILSQLFSSLPELQRLDLDPILVWDDGAKVADARMEWETYEVAQPTPARSSY